MESIYQLIENSITKAEDYVNAWLGYQALWDVQTSSIVIEIGEDLNNWRQLLNEIKAARATFDSSETEKHFGCIIIDYRAVQSKVANKYDQ